MKKQTNIKEQKLIDDYFYNFKKNQKANEIFDAFVERVNTDSIKNDGSDSLLSIVDNYVLADKNNPFYKTINKGSLLYRARVVDPNEMDTSHGFSPLNYNGYDENGSREAPLGKGGAGRNNISGVSYLYLAKKPETACCEVKPGIRQLISLAEFEVQTTMHVIDFSSDKNFKGTDEEFSLGRLFTNIMGMYFTPVFDQSQYKATQILTDYIRKTGVDGICYRSFYHDSGINYTIFNSDHRKISFKKSRIMLYQSERHTFLDFENKKVITADSVGGATYDSKSAESISSNIRFHILHKSKS